MANINRDYLIIADLKSGKITSPTMSFYNTDKNIANLFVKLQITMSNNPNITGFVNKEEASNYNVKLTVIKPKTTMLVELEGVTQDSDIVGNGAVYLFDMPQNFTDQVGKYICELEITCMVNGREEIVTCDPFRYTVKESAVTGLNVEIEPNPDVPVLKQLIDEVRYLQENEVSAKTFAAYQKITDDKLKQVEIDLNEAVANVTNGNESVTNSEIVLARKGKTSLREKIDEFDSQIKDIEHEKADKNQTANLQGQINSLVVNGTGNSNPEVIQARVNINGVEFGTLTERNLFVENTLNGSEFPISWSSWEEGGINTNTGLDTPISGYLRTVGYLNFNGLIRVTCDLTNCKVYVLEYSKVDKTFLKSTEKTSSFNMTSLINYFRIVIVPTTSGEELIPTNFLTMVGTYSFREINQLKDKTNDIPDIFNSCNKYIGGLSFKEKLKWEIGGINGALGTDVSIDYAIRSAFYTFNSKVEAISDKDMYCIAYNQDGTFNSRINKVNGAVTLTDTTKKYRFVVSNGSGNPVTDINLMLSFVTIKSKETFNENVLNIVNGSSPIFGKRLNILADSMGSVDYTLPNWWQQISNKTGAIFNNYAISGTCIGYNEERENTNGKCFCNRYMEMDSSADGVIVLGGTNDYEIKLGNWNDSKNETFYGALNVLMKGLLEKYKGKPIIFMTPVQQANDYINNMIDPVTPIQSNANSSIQLQLRAEAIKRKCMQYGITCIDLYNTSGINGVDTSKIYYRPSDVTHLSLLGQSIVANNLLPILESKFMF